MFHISFLWPKPLTKISPFLTFKDTNQAMQSSLHPSPPPEQGTGAGAEGKGAEWNRAQGDTVGLEEMLLCSSLVLHLLEEFVGGILVAVLLHLGQVTLLWCHSCIHLDHTVVN